MLPKEFRLRTVGEIQKAFRTKTQHRTPHVRIYLARVQSDNFKLLVVVSKKISTKAHNRNRVKRKIQAIFERLHAQSRLPPATSCVIQVTSKAIMTLTSKQLYDELIPVIGKLYESLAIKK